MFDYQTGYYEYNYRTLREAQEAKKQAGKGAKITTFFKHERKRGGHNSL